MPEGLESSSTNIASDHGEGNERRSIEITAGRSLYASRRTSNLPSALFGSLDSVSLTPPFRVGRPQIVRGGGLGLNSSPGRRQGADVPGGDPVGGIGILWNLDVGARQLLAKSYRARSGAKNRLAPCSCFASSNAASAGVNVTALNTDRTTAKAIVSENC